MHNITTRGELSACAEQQNMTLIKHFIEKIIIWIDEGLLLNQYYNIFTKGNFSVDWVGCIVVYVHGVRCADVSCLVTLRAPKWKYRRKSSYNLITYVKSKHTTTITATTIKLFAKIIYIYNSSANMAVLKLY